MWRWVLPSFFIVTTATDTPRLYISQKPYAEVLRALRAWPYSHTRRNFVFEVRQLPGVGSVPGGDPSGCLQLTLTARVEPDDQAEHYQYGLGVALDDLPRDQAVEKCKHALDYLTDKLHRYEDALIVPQDEATGT